MFVYNLAGVPTSATDFENNSNQKKYTVNQSKNNKISISKALCVVLVLLVLLLIAAAVAATYFLVVGQFCNDDGLGDSDGLAKMSSGKRNGGDEDYEQKRLPRTLKPEHYK